MQNKEWLVQRYGLGVAENIINSKRELQAKRKPSDPIWAMANPDIPDDRDPWLEHYIAHTIQQQHAVLLMKISELEFNTSKFTKPFETGHVFNPNVLVSRSMPHLRIRMFSVSGTAWCSKAKILRRLSRASPLVALLIHMRPKHSCKQSALDISMCLLGSNVHLPSFEPSFLYLTKCLIHYMVHSKCNLVDKPGQIYIYVYIYMCVYIYIYYFFLSEHHAYLHLLFLDYI